MRRVTEDEPPLEAISPYKNMGPQERLLPKLKARLHRHRRNNNLSLHEGAKTEDLDFRRLVQSIFDQTTNNPYATAIERKHRQWQRPEESEDLYQSIITSDSALRRQNKRTLRIVGHHRTISHEDGAKKPLQNLLSQLTVVAGEPQSSASSYLDQVEPKKSSPT